MTFTYEAPETFETGGGNWLKEPGTYHAIVLDVDEHPSSRDGKSLDAIRVQCQILAGTTPGQEGKQFDLMLWHPKLSDKNQGLFAKQKQGRFFIAAGLIDESVAGKKVDIDLQKARTKQIIFATELDDKNRLQLHFADIWHVDDPEAASFPKCEKSLKLIPADDRRDPSSFKKDKGNGKETKKPQPATSEVDLSDL